MERFARVAVHVPGLKGQFDYEIPDALLGAVQKGCLVEAPFGSQSVQGIVTQMLGQPGVQNTRPITALILDGPVITPPQLSLAEFLSRQFLAPLSEFTSLMLPPGLSQRADSLFSLNLPKEFSDQDVTPLQRRLIARLREKGPQRGRQLDRAFSHIDWRRAARSLTRQGLLVSRALLPEPKMGRKMARTAALVLSRDALEDALENAGRQGSAARGRRQAILRLLAAEGQPLDVSYIYASTGGNAADLNFLYRKGYLRYGEEEVLRDPLADKEIVSIPAPRLTRDQRSVWQKIQALMELEDYTKPVLLHGVTGSGKTELYMRAIERTLKEGRQAIVLVPEISLTPQTIERFTARFGRQVGVLHSKLSPGERFDTWRRAREADFSIAIGPRSALFTPFPNPGVIVVDEFHDESYTQTEISPYYRAVEAAIELGRVSDALVILGSATPDVSLYFRGQREKWPMIELAERIKGHAQPSGVTESGSLPLPDVGVVDMREELREGHTSIFSRVLIRHLEQVLTAHQQGILLLNRRGAATWVFCRDCGYTMKCARCDQALTWHSGASRLVCHTCGYRRDMPGKCPQCGSRRFKQFGTGTERVENDLQALFPRARLLRWDADSSRAKGAEEVILQRFRQHSADILIGTQMLAKGLDLPLVTLVGVVLADAGLNFPDFRTAERAFQLLTQVAGRAGRSELGGQVIVQTFQPEHYAIRHAAAHDFKGFYQEELENRRVLRYPPFVQMVRFEARALKNEEAQSMARETYRKLQRLMEVSGERQLELNPPVPSYFARRGGYYRWQVILKGSDPLRLIQTEDFSGIRVEVNPPSLL